MNDSSQGKHDTFSREITAEPCTKNGLNPVEIAEVETFPSFDLTADMWVLLDLTKAAVKVQAPDLNPFVLV